MAGIASEDDWIASYKQMIKISKITTRTTVASPAWFSLFDISGQPGAGTLAGTSTASGVIPTDATAGYPQINDFVSGGIGYISCVDASCSVACRFRLFDRLFVAGAYNYNANTTLSSQPSYSGRLPKKSDGSTTDYNSLEIWVETVVAPTGNLAVTVTYTNQDGTTGRSTGAVGISAAPTVGRCWQLPLQSGDTGVQKIESVVGSVASAGTSCFNVMVLRPFRTFFVEALNAGDSQDLFRIGLPQIFQDSALFYLQSTDSTSSGLHDIMIGIASK
jgi:hypothetical protein